MPFGPINISPINTKPGTAVGVSLPFNSPSAFYSTYTTKDATRNNLINLLLTDPGEKPLSLVGAGLQKYIFDQINNQTLDNVKEYIQSIINQYFTNIIIKQLDIFQSPDTNEINIQLYYNISRTGEEDKIEITLS